MATVYDIHHGDRAPVLEVRGLSVVYGAKTIVQDVTFSVPEGTVVAMVGPSGCGKSTLLKTFNRMTELNPDVSTKGEVLFSGSSIHDPDVDPAGIRRQVGMIFQNPNPFPTSVFENVAFGPRVHGLEEDLSGLVERSLRRAGLWEEVRDRLFDPAAQLSGGQQQRLCIARALAVSPRLLLMDEPSSDLDPASTRQIEHLIHELKLELTILLVTHNLQQAARVSDYTVFFQGGELVEYGPTSALFTNPREARTETFLSGPQP